MTTATICNTHVDALCLDPDETDPDIPEAVHDEVLARLLALNQQRAEEERKVVAPKPSPAKRSPTFPGPSLFRVMKPA